MFKAFSTTILMLIFLSSFAAAQEETPSSGSFYAGIGYSVPTRLLAQVGYDSSAFEAGFSGRASLQYAFGTSGFIALGDAMYKFEPSTVTPYFGGGLGVVSVFTTYGSATGFELHATGGSDFFVAENFSLFAELQPFLFLTPINYFDIRLNLGANVHF